MERNILYVILGLVVAMSIIIAVFLQPTSKPGETSTPGSTPTSTAQQPTSPQNTTTTMRHPFYPDRYSRYGGWLGLRVEGTGFFRVAVVNGKYWLVDPDGYVFISKGVNHVDYTGDFSPSLGYSPYYVNVLRKYGSASKWVDTTVNRLMKWGFNTIGAWSSRELYEYMPYTINLNILGNYGFNWTTGRMPDVFSDGFVDYVENNAYFNCQPLAEDPLLLGYFLDNELRWGPDWRSNTHLLDEFFKLALKENSVIINGLPVNSCSLARSSLGGEIVLYKLIVTTSTYFAMTFNTSSSCVLLGSPANLIPSIRWLGSYFLIAETATPKYLSAYLLTNSSLAFLTVLVSGSEPLYVNRSSNDVKLVPHSLFNFEMSPP